MTFEIWNEPDKKENVKKLRLVKDYDGINLVMVNDSGEIEAHILAFNENGVKLFSGSGDSGFKRNKGGCAKVTEQ